MSEEIILYGLIAITGAFFLYTGIMSLLRPKDFATALGLDPVGRSGIIEIRAQYGGFFTAASVIQFLALGGLIGMPSAFLVNLVIFGGLIAGRLPALFIGNTKEQIIPVIHMLFWVDAIGAAGSAAGFWLSHSA